ncbi:MAG TPA: Bax inhibitor-1/YccA family protein [Herpetosiphonaceae bacterium]|nr:Bax inhibitor-1/YccA family protein [Herpetosiphonaceae bacterium]
MSYSVPSLAGQFELRQRTVLQRVYAWMAGGLTVTGLVALWAASSAFFMDLLYTTPGVMVGLIIAELVVVLALSWGINRMSAGMAIGAFLLYAALNGLTLSLIFMVYTAESIGATFLITAGMFAGISLYGYSTKRDLSSMGSFLFMALIGIILASLANFFLKSTALYWGITYAAILVFVGLTAYDTQKIKKMSATLDGRGDQTMLQRVVIMGALTLYLDFINLFLYLLRIFGKRR